MKKHGVLNCEISEVVATMGHTDMLAIADARLPILDEVWRILQNKLKKYVFTLKRTSS